MGQKDHLSPIAHFAFRGILGMVANRRCRDAGAGADRGLEERRSKGQHLAAVRAGAFGKKQHGRSVPQPCSICSAGLRNLQAAAAVDKDRAAEAGQGTEKRPRPDLRLGHEDKRTHRAVDQDVQIGQVVGNGEPGDLRGPRDDGYQGKPPGDAGAGSMQPRGSAAPSRLGHPTSRKWEQTVPTLRAGKRRGSPAAVRRRGFDGITPPGSGCAPPGRSAPDPEG